MTGTGISRNVHRSFGRIAFRNAKGNATQDDKVFGRLSRVLAGELHQRLQLRSGCS
jgi:hypothetical protein